MFIGRRAEKNRCKASAEVCSFVTHPAFVFDANGVLHRIEITAEFQLEYDVPFCILQYQEAPEYIIIVVLRPWFWPLCGFQVAHLSSKDVTKAWTHVLAGVRLLLIESFTSTNLRSNCFLQIFEKGSIDVVNIVFSRYDQNAQQSGKIDFSSVGFSLSHVFWTAFSLLPLWVLGQICSLQASVCACEYDRRRFRGHLRRIILS